MRHFGLLGGLAKTDEAVDGDECNEGVLRINRAVQAVTWANPLAAPSARYERQCLIHDRTQLRRSGEGQRCCFRR